MYFGAALLHFLKSRFYGNAEADDSRHVFRSGSPASLLGAAMDKGTDFHAFADIQKSHALRPVKLMGAGAEHVNMQIIHIYGYMTVCLHGVGMK